MTALRSSLPRKITTCSICSRQGICTRYTVDEEPTYVCWRTKCIGTFKLRELARLTDLLAWLPAGDEPDPRLGQALLDARRTEIMEDQFTDGEEGGADG